MGQRLLLRSCTPGTRLIVSSLVFAVVLLLTPSMPAECPEVGPGTGGRGTNLYP